jgi:hypothetical protein
LFQHSRISRIYLFFVISPEQTLRDPEEHNEILFLMIILPGAV